MTPSPVPHSPCGCTIEASKLFYGPNYDPDDLRRAIKYCPLHASAAPMLELLKWIKEDDLLPMAYANKNGEIRDQLKALLASLGQEKLK